MDTPTSGPLYHTLIHLASKNANGMSTSVGAISGIWGEFTDQKVTRVDTTLMIYDPAQPGHTALTPLSRPDGHGQCSAWADLLSKMLGTQGITAQQLKITPAGAYDGFQVKAGTVQGDIALTAPNTQFNFHVVVKIAAFPDRIYDPSFGTFTDKTTATSVEQQWEDDRVIDYAGLGGWIGSNPAGKQLDWNNWP